MKVELFSSFECVKVPLGSLDFLASHFGWSFLVFACVV